MDKYAILNQDTHQVLNIVMIEDQNVLSIITKENEYFVPASRSVQIGMIFDTETQTFPDVFEIDRLFDLREKIELEIKNHESYTIESFSSNKENHIEYISKLRTILELTTYDAIKTEYDNVGPSPEFEPPLKQITQDLFRSVLKLNEKILWDNPETGTEIQKATINTLKMEFPFYGIDSMNEMFSLLEQSEVINLERIEEIKLNLDN